MRRWHAVGAITTSLALVALNAGHAHASDEAPLSGADIAKSFETQITQLDAMDPKSPDALEAHLRYAGYLAKVQGPTCNERLSAARSQLEYARQNVALAVILPQGLAQAADVDYQIHSALASCGDSADSSRRDAELQAALRSAEHAAELYRDTFDYPAMLTMQFNAACTQRSLGNFMAAATALEALIGAARELLRSWRQADNTGTTGQAAVPVPVPDVPARSTTLNFAWLPGDRSITLQTRSARVRGKAVVHAEGDRTLTQHIRKRPTGWVITYQSLGSHYSLETLPEASGMETSFMVALAGMLLEFHDFTLIHADPTARDKSANFEDIIDSASFNARVLREAQSHREAGALLGNASPANTAALVPRLKKSLQDILMTDVEAADTALDYNLQTGTWPGATLDQGQWYSMKLSLPLPFAPLQFVAHDVQFAFTRELPCDHDSGQICVELVLRAVPDAADLKYALRGMQQALHLRHAEKLNAWTTMYMRLITDPATLQAYHRDSRQFFYVSIDGRRDGALLGADQSTTDWGVVTPASN
jgi:hypothetical protein